MLPTAKPKPVNNIDDPKQANVEELAVNPDWRYLIPLTHFGEAEKPKVSQTRIRST